MKVGINNLNWIFPWNLSGHPKENLLPATFAYQIAAHRFQYFQLPSHTTNARSDNHPLKQCPMTLNEQNRRMRERRGPLRHYIDFDAIKTNRKLKRNKNILLSRALQTSPNLYTLCFWTDIFTLQEQRNCPVFVLQNQFLLRMSKSLHFFNKAVRLYRYIVDSYRVGRFYLACHYCQRDMIIILSGDKRI